MQLKVPFQQVDVFTHTPFKGNPVAVVLDGNELSSEEMQAIANWTNLSETTFVCKPTDSEADYQLRIFTPNSELPFAGHPTLGSAFALIQSGFQPKTPGYFVQESGIGLVTIHMDDEKMFFTLPASKEVKIEHNQLEELANALGIAANYIKAGMTIDVGAVWMTLQLADSELVRALQPDMEMLSSLTPAGVTGVTVFGPVLSNADAAFEVRSFAPAEGVSEDPVCGSGNGCVATMVQQLQLTQKASYVARQGYCVGRSGQIEIRYQENGEILVGGNAVVCIDGEMHVR